MRGEPLVLRVRSLSLGLVFAGMIITVSLGGLLSPGPGETHPDGGASAPGSTSDGNSPSSEVLYGPTRLDDTALFIEFENTGHTIATIHVEMSDANVSNPWRQWLFVYNDESILRDVDGLGERTNIREPVVLVHENERYTVGPAMQDPMSTVYKHLYPDDYSPNRTAEMTLEPGKQFLLVGIRLHDADVTIFADESNEAPILIHDTLIDPRMYRYRDSQVEGHWDHVELETYAVTRDAGGITKAWTREPIVHSYANFFLFASSTYKDITVQDETGRTCTLEGTHVYNIGALSPVGSSIEVRSLSRGHVTLEGTVVSEKGHPGMQFDIIDIPIPPWTGPEQSWCVGRGTQDSGPQ